MFGKTQGELESTGPGWSRRGGASLSALVSERRIGSEMRWGEVRWGLRRRQRGVEGGGESRLEIVCTVYCSSSLTAVSLTHTHLSQQTLPLPAVRQKHNGAQRKRGLELISASPPSSVCPIHCHAVALCTIILLNPPRIKHASHKECIYMVMRPQYSAERWDLTSEKNKK